MMWLSTDIYVQSTTDIRMYKLYEFWALICFLCGFVESSDAPEKHDQGSFLNLLPTHYEGSESAEPSTMPSRATRKQLC